MRRREFLKLAALGAASAAAGPLDALAARRKPKASKETKAEAKASAAKAEPAGRLAVVFLRGGLDGLSALVPYGDPEYRLARPTLALPGPGEPGGVLDLGGGFGLHPALASLLPLWRSGQLAFVPACGMPEAPREHKAAQAWFERAGAEGSSGWLGRLGAALPPVSGAPSISAAPSRPLVMRGYSGTRNLEVKGGLSPVPQADVLEMYDAVSGLYPGDEGLDKAFREGEARTRKRLEGARREMEASGGGATGDVAGAVGKLMAEWRRYPRSRLVFVEASGFDSHYGQGRDGGWLSGRLADVAGALGAMVRELGEAFSRTTIVVASEFGRSLAENGLGGLENGHGGLIWLLGGAIRGGRVLGDWPGLSRRSLADGRDVAVTTDVREVLAAACARGLGLEESRLAKVFPGFKPSGALMDVWG